MPLYLFWVKVPIGNSYRIWLPLSFSKILLVIDNKKKINPRLENRLLDEDEDAIAATIVASMDFYNETGKHPKVVSVKRREE